MSHVGVFLFPYDVIQALFSILISCGGTLIIQMDPSGWGTASGLSYMLLLFSLCLFSYLNLLLSVTFIGPGRGQGQEF